MNDVFSNCPWTGNDPLYLQYHDLEWGRPLHDDCQLFELLVLEGMQAGLSWLTVLRKRDHFRRVFAGFDPQAVARFDEAKIQALLQDAGIIRNRLKIEATVGNARALLALQAARGSFADWLWQYTGGRQIVNHWQTVAEVPARTALSDQISADLKRLGFKYVGSTICYAWMQSAGLVMDHLASCSRWADYNQNGLNDGRNNP